MSVTPRRGNPKLHEARKNAVSAVKAEVVEQLRDKYGQIYGALEPAYPDNIGFIGRLAFENIANSDADSGQGGWSEPEPTLIAGGRGKYS